nr:patched domain-containing protein 3 [Onthophagus taurus]
MGLRCVDDLLNKAFFRLGLFVGKHPGYFIIVPVLVTLLCVTGFQRIKYNIDPEYLFSPINGDGKHERAVVEKLFSVNYTSQFNVARITRAGRFGRVIVTSNDGNKNMLRMEIWKELRRLDEIIQNTTVYFDDEYYTYQDICAKWGNECFKNDILNLDNVLEDVIKGELNLTFPLMLNPVTWDTHVFPLYFGGTQLNEDGFIRSVPSVQLVYFANVDTKKLDAKGGAWEEVFLKIVQKEQNAGTFKHIRIALFASKTLDHELEKNTRSVIPYFSSTFIIMAIFSVVTCMMADWVRSKPWLGLLGNISATMATLSAFGLCMYIGVDFIGINLAAPFLMIGIGIDDTFVMLAAWRRTSIKDGVPRRMAQMLSEAAVSITITSITDMVSFFIGVFSPFPSVTIFCLYSGVATIFTFFWHLTFFAGCVAISGYCEQKNLHSVLCFKVDPVSKSKHRNWFYRVFCSGGVDPEDINNPLDNKEHGFMVFFRDSFAKFLNNGLVKTLIIFIFGFYLLGAFYGVTKIEEGLERRKVAKKDSYAIEFFDREDDYYREFPYRIQVIVDGEYDYSDPHVQFMVENLTQTFENTSYISNPLYTESWLRSFLQYINANAEYLNVSINTPTEFIKVLKEHWLYPASAFSLDVKFNEAGDKIIGMRFLIQAVNISGTEHEKEMVRAIRQLCKDSPLNVTVFHPYFVFFDQFELVRPLSIQNMILGAIVMMIISFLFIPNILCSIWVAFSIISIETGVIGYMALWKVNLDSISMINLIMCIGFSVDFTAHICYAYMSSKAKHPDERVKECLYALGLPIFQGSVSTILGMVALLLADNYIFSVFFKMVFLVVFCGAMHGLFLLPVLLSLFGPGACSRSNKSEKELPSIDSNLPRPYYIPHPQLTLNPMHLTSNLKLQNLPEVKKERRSRELDKDLGLGTSEENSSESSSNRSNNNNKNAVQEEEMIERIYKERWRRNSLSDYPQCEFHSSQVLDLYTPDWENTRERNISQYRSHHYQKPPHKITPADYRRRYSPPEHVYYRNPNLVRSNSYQNLNPSFIKELRFP